MPAVDVLAPFPDVALHVVQAPGIWILLCDGLGLSLAGHIEPGHLSHVTGIVTGRAGPASVFPFSFGRQPKVLSGLLGEPSAERVCVPVGHAGCRVVGALVEAGILPAQVGRTAQFVGAGAVPCAAAGFSLGLIAGGFDEGLELGDGDFCFADLKVVVDSDLVDGSFIAGARVRAHHEFTGRDCHQFEFGTTNLDFGLGQRRCQSITEKKKGDYQESWPT